MSLGSVASDIFYNFMVICLFSRTTLPQFGDHSRIEWFEDQTVMTWLLKLTIPLIGEPMKLITVTKAIWDE